MTIFKSIHHPRGRSRVLLYAEWLVRPLAICILPIMIVTLVEVLRGQQILGYVYFGVPIAFALASGWTAYRIRTVPAELVLSGPFAEVRTVTDALRKPPSRPWRIVLDARFSDHQMTVAIGESVYELVRAEWPDWNQVVTAVRRARYSEDEADLEAPSDAAAIGSME